MKKWIFAVLCCILVLGTISIASAKTCGPGKHPGLVGGGSLQTPATCEHGSIYVGECKSCHAKNVTVTNPNDKKSCDYQVVKCGMQKKCSMCKKKEPGGAIVNHDWIKASCREKKHCRRYPNNCNGEGKPVGGFDENNHRSVNYSTGKCRDCGKQLFNPSWNQ